MSNVSLRSKTEIHKYKGNSPRAAGFDFKKIDIGYSTGQFHQGTRKDP